MLRNYLQKNYFISFILCKVQDDVIDNNSVKRFTSSSSKRKKFEKNSKH